MLTDRKLFLQFERSAVCLNGWEGRMRLPEMGAGSARVEDCKKGRRSRREPGCVMRSVTSRTSPRACWRGTRILSELSGGSSDIPVLIIPAKKLITERGVRIIPLIGRARCCGPEASPRARR